MNGQRFDRLVKDLAGESRTRRGVIRAGLAMTVALASALAGTRWEVSADHHHGRRRRQRRRNRPPRDCAPLEHCFFAENPLDPRPMVIGSLPGAPIPTCWRWRSLACVPCNGTKSSVYNALCNATYSTCQGKCKASSA